MSNIKWKKVSQERFNEMLEILPPVGWCSKGFMVGEAWSHQKCTVSGEFRASYGAFVEIGDKYYEALSPMTLPEFRALELSGVTSNVTGDV